MSVSHRGYHWNSWRNDITMNEHGGDIYNNRVDIDYSVNLNPEGIPYEVKVAIVDTLENINKYPDMDSAYLRDLIAGNNNVSRDEVVITSGASEAIMAAVRVISPNKALLIEPSFYGYRHALEAVSCKEIVQYRAGCDYLIGEDLFDMIDSSVDVIFINNPNNPTGRLIDDALFFRILDKARTVGTKVILDESFYYMSAAVVDRYNREIGRLLKEYEGLYIIRSYTKLFAIPGVRAGYVLSNSSNCVKLTSQLPEWNVSEFAKRASITCERIMNEEYVGKVYRYIVKERKFLKRGLESYGLKTHESDTCYFLVEANTELYAKLLDRKILVRDCSNFDSLCQGTFRLAVKDHESNVRLLEVIGEIYGA